MDKNMDKIFMKLYITIILLGISIVTVGVGNVLNILQVSQLRSDLRQQTVITDKLINLDSEIVAKLNKQGIKR